MTELPKLTSSASRTESQPGQKTFMCTFSNCGKTFSKQCELSRHIVNHIEQKQQTVVPSQKTLIGPNTFENAKEFQNSVLEHVNCYRCLDTNCKETFSSVRELREHISTFHCKSKSKPMSTSSGDIQQASSAYTFPIEGLPCGEKTSENLCDRVQEIEQENQLIKKRLCENSKTINTMQQQLDFCKALLQDCQRRLKLKR